MAVLLILILIVLGLKSIRWGGVWSALAGKKLLNSIERTSSTLHFFKTPAGPVSDLNVTIQVCSNQFKLPEDKVWLEALTS